MKKFFLVSLLFPISFFLVVSGCSKSNNNAGGGGGTQESAKMVLMTKTAWKLDTSGVDIDKNGTIDIAGDPVPDCEKDNTYTFRKDSTGVIGEGATKCNPSDPDSTSFTWNFNTDETILQSNFDPSIGNGVNISTLSDTQLILYKDTVITGFSFRYIIELKH